MRKTKEQAGSARLEGSVLQTSALHPASLEVWAVLEAWSPPGPLSHVYPARLLIRN